MLGRKGATTEAMTQQPPNCTIADGVTETPDDGPLNERLYHAYLGMGYDEPTARILTNLQAIDGLLEEVKSYLPSIHPHRLDCIATAFDPSRLDCIAIESATKRLRAEVCKRHDRAVAKARRASA